MSENMQGKSFVTIMVIIAFFALLLRVSIKQIIRINIAQNESNAQTTLKLISTALENYATNHQDVFPVSLDILLKTTPSYLDKNYILESPIKGYNYSCSRLEPNGYTCMAIPVKCKLTGRLIYTVTTDNLLILEECNK